MCIKMPIEYRCRKVVSSSYEVYLVADDEEQAERKAEALPLSAWTETTDERNTDNDIEVDEA